MVVAALALVALAALVFNTGNQVARKIEMQNAADTAAVSGAMWIARGMNLISMNNVAMTETLAVIANIIAMDQAASMNEVALEIVMATATALEATVFGAPLGFALEAGYWVLGEPTTEAVSDVAPDLVSELAQPSSTLLWQFMQGLSAFSGVMTVASPLIAEGEAYSVGTQNIPHLAPGEKSVALLLPNLGGGVTGLMQGVMPVEAGNFSELCDPARYGTHSSLASARVDRRGYNPLLGYSLDQGPFTVWKNNLSNFWWLSWVTLIQFWYGGVADSVLSELCGDAGSAPPPTYTQMIKDLSAARAAGATTYIYIYSSSSSSPICTDPSVTSPPPAGATDPNSGQTYQVTEPANFDPNQNDARSQPWTGGNGNWSTTTNTSQIGGVCSAPNTEQWTSTRASYNFAYATVNKAIPQSPMAGGDSSDYPQPYHMTVNGHIMTGSDDDMAAAEQKLQYLGIAYRGSTGGAWLSKLTVSVGSGSTPVFNNPNTFGVLTYAQAQVYNPTSWDLYTQDWHVKLVPANLIGSGIPGASAGIPPSIGGTISQMLNAH
jgi:hypothetical protein